MSNLSPPQHRIIDELRAAGGRLPLRGLHKSTVRALELRGIVRLRQPRPDSRPTEVQVVLAPLKQQGGRE